jgi:Flp pilus assembly protein TadG
MSRSSDRGTEAGQALVEFALVVPLLLLLVVGVIEFGRAWNVSQAVNYAARQGARTAAVLNGQLPPSQIEDSVVAVVTDALGSNNVACNGCVEQPIPGAGVGQVVTVTVSVPYQFIVLGPIMELASLILDADDTFTLRSTSVMRNE